MDSFEINKIVGAILGTLVMVMGVGFIAEAVYHPIEDNGAAYALPEPEVGADAGAAEEVVKTPIGVLLASANIDDGAKVARKCVSCHNFAEGEGNKTGPALYDIVGATLGSVDGFSYSDIFAQYAAEGQTWTYEALDEFLAAPKAFAPGTKMTFAGLRKEEDRANLLAYLQTLSASPVPFPEVVEEPMETEMAAVEEAVETLVEETSEAVETMVEETAEAVEETMEAVQDAVETVTEEVSESAAN